MMTAAASKYTSTAPSMRKASGKMPGATVATTLNSQATPVPIAMRVNMFSLIVRTEAQPRTKNGDPAHRTTGVARASWIHVEADAETASCNGSTRSRPMPRTRTGRDRATPTQKRRVMSRSSGDGPASAVTVTGSSAMPQIGHDPGPGRRISGCIGHVYSTTSPLPGGVGSLPASVSWCVVFACGRWVCASMATSYP